MQTVITKTDYNFKDLKSKYEGKVRDVFSLNSNNYYVITIQCINISFLNQNMRVK